MSNVLRNGTVLPSSLLSLQSSDFASAFNKTYENVQLRAGIVTKVYEIDDKSNHSKVNTEYDVQVMEQDSNRGSTTITYKNCIALDAFGGMSDFLDVKFRAKKVEKNKGDSFSSDGSLVLLLCLDGSSEKAIIIGGIKHMRRLSTLTSKEGLRLEGQYNGINWTINNDGALVLTFKGPTENDGKLKKEDVYGSQFKIEKDGSLELNSQYKDQTKPFDKIRIDKTKGNIETSCRKDQVENVGGDNKIDIKGNLDVKTGKDWLVKCTGSCNLAMKIFDVKVEQGLTIAAKECQQIYETKCSIKAQKIELNGDLVSVGSDATAAALLGPQVLTWLQTHTHTGNLGAPTSPPSTPPPASLLSKAVTLKE